jgi:hypothetical protein
MIRCTSVPRVLTRTRPVLSSLYSPFNGAVPACRCLKPPTQSSRSYHVSSVLSLAKPTNPDPRENAAHEIAPKQDINVGRKRFADFEMKGKVFVVTGGAQGLGLALAESLVEAGGKGSF